MVKKILIAGSIIGKLGAITVVEPVDIASKPNGNSNSIDLGYSISSGNSDTSKLNAKIFSDYSSDKSYKFIVGDYTYGKSRGKESVNRYYLHSRILQKLYGLHVWELFGQIEGNRFQNLKLRELLGVGVRFKLMRYLYLGSGLLYVHENLKDSDSNSFPSGNIYIAYKDSFKLNVPLDLIYTGYFQPTLEDGSDYHTLQKLKVSIPITDSVNLNFKLEHSYDSIHGGWS